MKKQTSRKRPTRRQPAPLATHADNLASLAQELNRPITHASLTRWASVSDSRKGLLTETIWGTIRWSKELGRPKTNALSDGFIIIHDVDDLNWAVGPGGVPQDLSKWELRPAPSVWDGPAEAQEYVVHFFTFAVRVLPNRIRVAFAPVEWDIPQIRIIPNGYPIINPPEQTFVEFGEITVLPDFNVLQLRIEP